MSSATSERFSTSEKLRLLSVGNLCKSLAVSGLVLYVLFTFQSNHPNFHSFELLAPSGQKWAASLSSSSSRTNTNITHLVFGIAGSVNAWRHRKSYVEAWWQPNKTRGYLFFERSPTEEFLPWPATVPAFRVSEDTSKFEVYTKHVQPLVIRIVRVVLETFREENEGVRWYIMGDDDTIFFIENLVEVLAKYDHTKHFYVGANSESVKSNADHSFEMAFGGAGFALSYSLVAALATNLDECINRYPYLYVSDQILQSCIADLGVSRTLEKGFHQIDLHNDISGLLSAHPESPLVSLHHLDAVAPIFPSMNSYEALNHLMKAAKADQSHLLQQTICYQKQNNWTFSISWGYSAYIYESIYSRSILQRPLETFTPWKKNNRGPPYMFNTRFLSNDPCEAPHVFFFDSLESTIENQIVTTYIRTSPSDLPACAASGNHSANPISKIQVFLPKMTPCKAGLRINCCDAHVVGMNVTVLKIRTCMENEILA